MTTMKRTITVESSADRKEGSPCFGPLCLLAGGLSERVKPARETTREPQEREPQERERRERERRERERRGPVGMVLCSQPLISILILSAATLCASSCTLDGLKWSTRGEAEEAGTATVDDTDTQEASACTENATEVCDGLDNDCDGIIDEDAMDRTIWFYDGDGDGYGSDSSTVLSCTQPDGYAAWDGDCDDTNPVAYPGAEETCRDEIDLNCDGAIDFIPLPTTCEVHLMQQNQFTSLDLNNTGLSVGSVSLSGHSLLAHSGLDVIWPPGAEGWNNSFLAKEREAIATNFDDFLETKFDGPQGIPADAVVVLDMEHPIHPKNFHEYLEDPEMFTAVIEAFTLRIDVARTALPNHPIALYGIVVANSKGDDEGFADRRSGYVAAGEEGLYDDVDYLTTVLYHRWGVDDPNQAERRETSTHQGLAEPAALTRTDGSDIPLLALVNLKVANGNSLNHGDVPLPTHQDEVVDIVLSYSEVEILAFWTGSDTHAESLIDTYGDIPNYFESVETVPIADCSCPEND